MVRFGKIIPPFFFIVMFDEQRNALNLSTASEDDVSDAEERQKLNLILLSN